MNGDLELSEWRRQWQSEADVPADLRRRVERQSLWMKIGLAADGLVTVGIGGWITVWTTLDPRPDMLLLTAATWIFIAAAWIVGLTMSRGLWSPAAIDTATFVDLSIRRCRARISALSFGFGLVACEVAFLMGWLYHRTGEVWRTVPAWVLGAAFFVALFWYRRKKRAELVYLLALRDE